MASPHGVPVLVASDMGQEPLQTVPAIPWGHPDFMGRWEANTCGFIPALQLAMSSSPCAVPATLLHFTAGKGMEGREGVSSLGVTANPKVGNHKILPSFSLPRLSLQLVFILAETPLGF